MYAAPTTAILSVSYIPCPFVVRVPWREALTIGTLMNTRGLVELIALNLGLDAKVSESARFLVYESVCQALVVSVSA